MMKFALVAILAVASVAQGLVIPWRFEADPEPNNVIDTVVLEALDYIKVLLKKIEPVTIPKLPELDIKDDVIDVKLSLSNFQVDKLDDYTVQSVNNNLDNLEAKFALSAPAPHFTGNYAVTGSVQGKKVSGSGTYNVDVTDIDFNGDISITIDGSSVSIKSLTLSYDDLKAVKVTLTGLTVEGWSEADLEAFLNTKLIQVLNQQKTDVAKRVADQIVSQVNAITAGKSLVQVFQWLKQFIPK